MNYIFNTWKTGFPPRYTFAEVMVHKYAFRATRDGRIINIKTELLRYAAILGQNSILPH